MTVNLCRTLERAASQFGDSVAVVDGETRFTYSELDRRVAAFDAGCAASASSDGDVVGDPDAQLARAPRTAGSRCRAGGS